MSEEKYPGLPILVVDDDENFLNGIKAQFRLNGISNVELCSDSREVMSRLDKSKYSLALLDIAMPHFRGDELLPLIVEKYPLLPVIVLTAYNAVDLAFKCRNLGAVDYLVKNKETVETIDKVRSVLGGTEFFSSIVTESKKMHALFQQIRRIAKSKLPILVTGETGVGKELICRAIHQASGRKGGFVKVNIGGHDDELLNSMLFGHKKGAFTGSFSDRKGLIEEAADGTLFLDEIGRMSFDSQVKLLRLIENEEYFPLGVDQAKTSSARIIGATNIDLKDAIEESRFLEDLLYRFDIQLTIPPLRDRKEDIPSLIDHFLEVVSENLGLEKRPKLSPECYSLLSNHDFEGNIRGLKNTITKALSGYSDGVVPPDVFGEILGKEPAKVGPNLPGDFNLFHSDFVEASYYRELLSRTDGNQTKAAELADIERRTFSNRLKNVKERLAKKNIDFSNVPRLSELSRLLEKSELPSSHDN